MIAVPSATQRAVLLAGPLSVHRPGRVVAAVADALRAGVEELTIATPRSTEEADRIARTAVRSGVDVLVVLGGDRLAHIGIGACADSTGALALIPTGPAEPTGGALWGPAPPRGPVAHAHELAGLLGCGARRRIDLGSARPAQPPSGEDAAAPVPPRRWWAGVLCVGPAATSITRAVGDPGLLLTLARTTPRRVVVEADTGTLELDALFVAVGNGPRSHGGRLLCPDARPDDGLLDVMVLTPVARRHLPALTARMRTGRHIDDPAVRTLRARRIHLDVAGRPAPDRPGPRSAAAWGGRADGVPIGPLPMIVECAPRALVMVAP